MEGHCWVFNLLLLLMNAVYVQHFHCSFALLGGARVDLVDQDGHSLLHWAALGGNADVCQILIENKINPNVQDYAGRTPLQCAAYGGYINCMAVLMENSADPNIQDKEVETQAFCAASSLVQSFLLRYELGRTVHHLERDGLHLSVFSSRAHLYLYVI